MYILEINGTIYKNKKRNKTLSVKLYKNIKKCEFINKSTNSIIDYTIMAEYIPTYTI